MQAQAQTTPQTAAEQVAARYAARPETALTLRREVEELAEHVGWLKRNEGHLADRLGWRHPSVVALGEEIDRNDAALAQLIEKLRARLAAEAAEAEIAQSA